MVAFAKIVEYANEIARVFHPQKVVLFGSYADGTPTEDSDVDLLVVMAYDRKMGRKSLEIRRELHSGFPMDLIVRTPETIEERLKIGDCFIREIMERGKVLYEADHEGMAR